MIGDRNILVQGKSLDDIMNMLVSCGILYASADDKGKHDIDETIEFIKNEITNRAMNINE